MTIMTDYGLGAAVRLPETAHGHDPPLVRQFSLFLENRLGVLKSVLSAFHGIDSRLVAINVLETSDSAIIRVVFDNSDEAREVITRRRMRFLESDLLVVAMPDDEMGLMSVCSALFAAEVNILYMYPLLVRPMGRAAIALRVDEAEHAAAILEKRKFALLDESALRRGPE